MCPPRALDRLPIHERIHAGQKRWRDGTHRQVNRCILVAWNSLRGEYTSRRISSVSNGKMQPLVKSSPALSYRSLKAVREFGGGAAFGGRQHEGLYSQRA